MTAGNAIGAADENSINWWLVKDETEKFLRTGNEFLFVWNSGNYILLIDGQEIPTLEKLRGKDLDRGLVRFEQQKVEEFKTKYFSGQPAQLKKKVIGNIDDLFNGTISNGEGIFAPRLVQNAIAEEFTNKGKTFHFDSQTDRINLGYKLLDYLYKNDP